MDLFAAFPPLEGILGSRRPEQVQPRVRRQHLSFADVVHGQIGHAEDAQLLGEEHAREGPEVQGAVRVRDGRLLLEVVVACQEERFVGFIAGRGSIWFVVAAVVPFHR